MGMYDTYGQDDCYGTGGIQLKAGNPNGNYYKLGAKSPIADGVYIAQDGIVLICEGEVRFVGNIPIFTKWGDEVSYDEILDKYDYMKQAVNAAAKDIENSHWRTTEEL